MFLGLAQALVNTDRFREARAVDVMPPLLTVLPSGVTKL
jgi:hypothetical protein